MFFLNSNADKSFDVKKSLKYMDYSGHKSINEETSYLIRTLNMVIYGSFTDDFTWAGLGIQLVLGIVGIDAVFDARDFIADATVNRDMDSPGWWATMALDLIAFVPLIGVCKYADELGYGVKTLFKNGDELAGAAKAAFKNGDELADGTRRIARAADAFGNLPVKSGLTLNSMAETLRELVRKSAKNADMLGDVRYADDVVDVASDVGKRLDDVAGGGLDALSTPNSRVLRQNMIDAGIQVPDYPNAAHHIVAGSSPKAAEARAILQKYGVDINDAANGTFLPTVRDVADGAYHPSLHTDSYYRKITELLSSAKSKNDVLDILDDIAEQLQNNTF